MPDPERITAAGVGSLVARMSGPGAEVAFSTQLAPVQQVPGNACSRYAWSHVGLVLRGRLRQAYAHHLADKVSASRPAHDIGPPDPEGAGVPVSDGCLYCGRGALTRTAAQVSALGGTANAQRDLWRPLSVEPSVLGGRPSPQPITGYICEEACGDAIDTVGSIGLSSLERAFTRWLRTVGRDDDALRVERGEVRVTAWGALAANARQRGHTAKGSGEPWSHVNIG